MEGSMIGRDTDRHPTEDDVKDKMATLLKERSCLFFIACSSQNIDRLVSIYLACVNSGRIFVIDPYTAYILDKLKPISKSIPQYDWGKNIRVFFVPNRYTEKMAENKSLYKFKSAKITYEQMREMRNQLVIKDTYLTRKIFAKKQDLTDTTLIYSMWNGYLPDVKPFWEQNNVPIVEIHASGHAYVEDLQDFVKALNPRHIIPNHTFYPEDMQHYLEIML